jgi:hypothetical protein
MKGKNMKQKQVIRLSGLSGIGIMLTLKKGDLLIGPLLIHTLTRDGDPDEEDIPTVLAVTDDFLVPVDCAVGLEHVTWKGKRVWATSQAALDLAKTEHGIPAKRVAKSA